jgi:hypothetical protein
LPPAALRPWAHPFLLLLLPSADVNYGEINAKASAAAQEAANKAAERSDKAAAEATSKAAEHNAKAAAERSNSAAAEHSAKATAERDICVDRGDPNAVADGNWCSCKAGFEYHYTGPATYGVTVGWSTKYHIKNAGLVHCQVAVPRDDCVDRGDENAVQDGGWCSCKTGFEYFSNNVWSTKYHMSQAGSVKCEVAVPRDDCVDKGDENAVQDGNWCSCKTGFEIAGGSTKYHINQAGSVKCGIAPAHQARMSSMSTTPPLLRTQKHTFGTGNINEVAAMDTDGSFIYTAAYGHIIKENKMDMNDFGVLNLADNGYADVSTLRVDADSIFVTATKTGYGASQCLVKVDKTTMQVTHTHTFQANQNIAYSMALDEDHIYTGMVTMPGRVLMLKKTTLDQVSEVMLAAGEDDLRSLLWSANDPSHIFANCYTTPGRVVKIKIVQGGGLQRTGAVTLGAGEDKIMAGVASDGEFLYVGTGTSPAKVVKINSMHMALAGSLTLEAGEDKIVSMIADSDFLYAGTETSPGKIVRVRRSGFVRVDALTLSTDENTVSAMTHGGGRIFAGLATSPARVVAVSGFLEPVDCIVSDWSAWTACDKTCIGGQQHRQRSIISPMQNGGGTCPSAGELDEVRACAVGVVCPVACSGGEIWMAGTGSNPRQRTCANKDDRVLSPKERCAHEAVTLNFPFSTQHSSNGAPAGCIRYNDGRVMWIETCAGHANCGTRSCNGCTVLLFDEESHCQCPPHKPFWHHDSFCASADICDRGVTTLCLPADLTCQIVAGKFVIARHSERNIQDFHCRHHPGVANSNCRCLCKIGSE